MRCISSKMACGRAIGRTIFSHVVMRYAAWIVGAEVCGALACADQERHGTNTIESLTVEQAKSLVASREGKSLSFNSLTTIDEATATALADFNGNELRLQGLTTIDAAAASSLAAFKGVKLCLDGLTTLDVATATAFAAFKGRILSLDGLEGLGADVDRLLRANPCAHYRGR